MGWMYYYDYYFLILVVPAMLIALWAQIKVKTTFASQSKRLSSRGLTGAQAAMQVLKYYGINDVRIERVAGDLTDHYDPRTNVIRLSDKVYNNTSIAAIGMPRGRARRAACRGLYADKNQKRDYPCLQYWFNYRSAACNIGIYSQL